jgi:hypothetical protein
MEYEIGQSPTGEIPKTIITPYCIHGPTILFDRFCSSKNQTRQFFACAVHRTRKGCQFFHWADDPLPAEKLQQYLARYINHQATLSTVPLPKNTDRYCTSCDEFFINSNDESHKNHVINIVNKQDLIHPTSFLYPQCDNKSQAQFFYSHETLSFLLAEIKRLKFSHIICLGTPKLHEKLSSLVNIFTFLLDVDHRFVRNIYSNNLNYVPSYSINFMKRMCFSALICSMDSFTLKIMEENIFNNLLILYHTIRCC